MRIPVVVSKNQDWADGFVEGYNRAQQDWLVPKWEAWPNADMYGAVNHYTVCCRLFKRTSRMLVSRLTVEEMERNPMLLIEVAHRLLYHAFSAEFVGR